MHISKTLGLTTFLAFTLSVTSAFGDTTIGSLDNTGFNASGGHAYLGESFIVPAGETGLSSASLVLHGGNGGDASGMLRIYSFSDDGSTGVFGTQLGAFPITVPGNSAAATYSHEFDLPVTEGKYALIADWGANNNAGGYFSNSSYYTNGNTIFAGAGGPGIFSSFDLAFQVVFGPIPEPTTLAILAPLGLLLGRRRITQH